MSEAGKVSVIIPSYNYARHLPECIQSVLFQTYKNWEAIIIDDGSRDNTPQVAAELIKLDPSRIIYIRTENRGVTHARNLAVEKASGEFILPLDADDVLMPSALEEFVREISKDEKIGFAYSALENFGPLPTDKSVWTPGSYARKALVRQNCAACTSIWRKSLWQEGVRYRELIFEDWDLWLQIAARGYEGSYIPKILFRYRMHPHGRNTLNKNRFMQAWGQEIQNNPGLYDDALQNWASLSFKHFPQCIKIPSVVFVTPTRTSGQQVLTQELIDLAKAFIDCGHYVALCCENDAVNGGLDGLTLLRFDPAASPQQMEDQLYKLGKELIVISDLGKELTARIRALNNVATYISLKEEYDNLADFNLQLAGGIKIDARKTLSFDPASIKTNEDLVNAILQLECSNQENKQSEEFNFREKLLAAPTAENDGSYQNPAASLAVVLATKIVDPKRLEDILRSIRYSQFGKAFQIKLVTEGQSAVTKAELANIIREFEIELIPYEDGCEWSTAHAYNLGSQSVNKSWICFVPANVSFSQDLINTWGKYHSLIGRNALYISEAEKISFLTEDYLDYAAKIYGASFVNYEVFKELSGFSLACKKNCEIDEFADRAGLIGIRKVVLDKGLTTKHWSLISDIAEAAVLEKQILQNNLSAEQKYQYLAGIAAEFLRLGDYFAAIEMYEELLSVKPDDAEVHAGLAHAYLFNSNFSRADHHSLRAIQIDGSQRIALEVRSYVKSVLEG